MKYFLVTLLAFTSFMFSISAQTLNVSGIYEVPIEENAQIQPKLVKAHLNLTELDRNTSYLSLIKN